jgi:hypothetical protein
MHAPNAASRHVLYDPFFTLHFITQKETRKGMKKALKRAPFLTALNALFFHLLLTPFLNKILTFTLYLHRAGATLSKAHKIGILKISHFELENHPF